MIWIKSTTKSQAYWFGTVGAARTLGAASIMRDMNIEATNRHRMETSCQFPRLVPAGSSRGNDW